MCCPSVGLHKFLPVSQALWWISTHPSCIFIGEASVLSIPHFGKEAHKVCICLFTLSFMPFWDDRHPLNQGGGPTWTRGKPILGSSVASQLSRSWLSGYQSQIRSTGLIQHKKMWPREHGGYPGKNLSQLLLTELSVWEQWITPAYSAYNFYFKAWLFFS